MDSESYICIVFCAYGHSHNRSNQRKRGYQLGSRRHGRGLSERSWDELEKRKGKGCKSVSKNEKNESFLFKKFYEEQCCGPTSQFWFSFVTTYCGILPEYSLVLYLFLSGRHFSTIPGKGLFQRAILYWFLKDTDSGVF